MAEYPLTSLQPRSLFSRRLRLASGIVLFTYVASHLGNHAVGLVSLAGAEAVRLWFLAAWRSLPLTALFYGALAAHIVLAFTALYERRTLRMPPLEFVRIVMGLCIPLLLAVHFANTRLAFELYGLKDDYARIVRGLWVNDMGLSQLALMCIAWLHGCLGIHFVLRHRPFYRRWFHLAFACAVLLPVLAALGFLAMAREISQRLPQAQGMLDAARRGQLDAIVTALTASFALALAAVMLARMVREWRERRGGLAFTLSYPDRSIRVPRGWSVLEASRAHGIAHLSMCGGRARCSTCRVRVVGDPASVPPPSAAEQRTLQRIGADMHVRLACQLRPTGNIAVTPMLSATTTARPGGHAGVEREVVVLFIDLRHWTTVSQQHLPHDLAYVLDQFFAVVGDAVRQAGGIPNQFIGDSVMAIFGIEKNIATACRQALDAARAIEAGMESGNERMRRDFGHSFEFGIGIHAGPAAVGEVGWQETRTFTAVGDTVNTAARLQELCKGYGVRLVVSEQVLQGAKVDALRLARHTISVRGRTEDLVIYAVASPSELELESDPN